MQKNRFQIFILVVVAIFLVHGCASSGPKSDTVAGSDSAPAAAASQPPAATGTVKSTTPRQRTDPPPKPDISCTKATDTRLLEIEEVKTGCWLFYVNKEIKKRTAWSLKGNAHCERVRDQIRSSLEKAGYKCEWVQ